MKFHHADNSSAAMFVKACKRAKERNLVDELLDPFRLLEASGKAPDDVRAALKLFQRRPWYSAQELAWFWPLISIGVCGKAAAWKPDAARLSARLVQCRLPRLRKFDGSYDYVWQGAARQYFLVQDVNRWRRLRVSQHEFEGVMHGQG